MTEIDTSRIDRPCPNCGVTLNGWSGLRYFGHYTTHAHADCIRNLRHRAEKAEAERDDLAQDMTAAQGQIADAQAILEGRDTAWNDAIEAGIAHMVDAQAKAFGRHVSPYEMRKIKKGETA